MNGEPSIGISDQRQGKAVDGEVTAKDTCLQRRSDCVKQDQLVSCSGRKRGLGSKTEPIRAGVSSFVQSKPNLLANGIVISDSIYCGYGESGPLAREKAKPIKANESQSCGPRPKVGAWMHKRVDGGRMRDECAKQSQFWARRGRLLCLPRRFTRDAPTLLRIHASDEPRATGDEPGFRLTFGAGCFSMGGLNDG